LLCGAVEFSSMALPILCVQSPSFKAAGVVPEYPRTTVMVFVVGSLAVTNMTSPVRGTLRISLGA